MTFLSFLKIGCVGIILLTVCSFSKKGEVSVGIEEPIGTWIDTVIMHSKPRANTSVDFYSDEIFVVDIDSVFFKEHLSKFETAFPRNWEIGFDTYSRYYFYDYQRYESWVSFTIIHNTEYGYDVFYTYSYDIKSNKITSVSCIAQVGADGGAVNKDYLFYSDSGRKLTVRSQSYYDEDIFEDNSYSDCYSRSFDSIVSHFHFYPDRTEFSVDTVFSKLDTICRQ